MRYVFIWIFPDILDTLYNSHGILICKNRQCGSGGEVVEIKSNTNTPTYYVLLCYFVFRKLFKMGRFLWDTISSIVLQVLSRAINFGRQCHFKIWLDCHKFKKFPCQIMPTSTKFQKIERKMTINVIQHDDRL
jgi:hypothetical protein